MKTYKSQIILALTFAFAIIMFLFIGEIILPFIIGLFLAYIAKSNVKRIQSIIPNWNIAASLFVLFALVLSTVFISFLGNRVVHDVKRLNTAFVTFSENHSDQIDETSGKIKSYIQKLYPFSCIFRANFCRRDLRFIAE